MRISEHAVAVPSPVPPDSVLTRSPSQRFAYGRIRKVSLDAGIDWSKLWPEVVSRDKPMPYEMVRCTSRWRGERFTLAITGGKGCQSHNAGTCTPLIELSSLRSSFSTLASARIIVALPCPLCVRKLVEYPGSRVVDKSLPAANVLLSRSRLKWFPTISLFCSHSLAPWM
jgi:hypothetical protein